MTETEKIEYATTAFLCLVNEKQDRLRRGLILRQKMHDAIERGEEPTGYRAEWLKGMVKKVAALLAQESEQFNKTYVSDMASVPDLLDILATVTHEFHDGEEDAEEEEAAEVVVGAIESC